MPRSAAVTVENNFTKGLITEVTGVNSPENSVSESVNVVYDRRGRASTRPGFQYEESFVKQPILGSGVISEFLWETVSNNNGVNFEVVQTGYTLRFFLNSPTTSLSGGLKSFSVDLRTYKVAGFTDLQVQSSKCAFTSGKGYLFVAHPNCETVYIKYDAVADTISVNPITILVRDFEGLPDTIAVDARLGTITNVHKYNLFNQGWYATVKTKGASAGNALNRWYEVVNNYPSNVDFWWYYVSTDTEGANTGEDNFDPATQNSKTALLGNTPAPKGHYVLNALQTNRSTLSGIDVTETTSNGYRASVVAFFAGRAFYSGVGASGFSSTVYFSQIVESDDQLSKCYQTNDPTSKEYFDLIDSDGGTIKIQDINTIIDMRVIGQALYIFASNGVWSVAGTAETGFKATDYTVSKVSSFPAISRSTIVDVGGLPVWWNYEGIFSLQKSQAGLTTEVTNLSQSTMQGFYDLIPQNSKLNAKGSYNDQQGLVYWLYNAQTSTDNTYLNILVLDAVTGAFYPLEIPIATQTVVGVSAMRSSGLLTSPSNVIVLSNQLVTDSSLNQVYINQNLGFSSKSKVFKFLTAEGSNLTFSSLDSEDSLDWSTVAYSAYFITGYRIRGDLIKRFQTNYLAVITQDIDDGSCYHQNLWDYSSDNNSGRFSNPQQVYRSRSLRNYQRSKLKTRGNGYSLQFKFFNEPGKPFIIVGWSGFETSDQMP